MKIERKFTQQGKDVFENIKWSTRSSRITNLDGSVVFEMHDVEVPASWSQLATDIMVSKYFRKAGVPQRDDNGNLLIDDCDKPVTGPEKSVRQIVQRLAGCWRDWGERYGYFDTAGDAQAFFDETSYMLLHQMVAPNSPQWFNTGLHNAYGIQGPPQGHWVTDPQTGKVVPSPDAYSHPQPHACFIQSIDDDLVNPGGIMDLWVREARLFKYGSGTGTNFSKIRGANEPLSGGGKSSGLMSWLKIGDRAAGAIKSGGTTRRAAKMVCLDLDHPDAETFINWKVREELKVAAMVAGMDHLSKAQKQMACDIGLELDFDFNGESYQTVSGQNSNNSVRITNEFFKRLDDNGEWDLIRRTDGKVDKTLPANTLWGMIGHAAWQCADPGVQYDTTINQWHTCPASGRINASNPCSEYMFLDNTACNLASLNLLKFFDADTRNFDLDGFEHAVHLWTIVLEISVLMASFPSEDIARLSYEYRTLGLGYANIGAMLMQAGIAYDSDKARAICGAITSILTGRSYATSGQLAGQLGPFPGYTANSEHMLRVIRNHRRAAYGVARDPQENVAHELGAYEGLEIPPVPIDGQILESDGKDLLGNITNSKLLLHHARAAWDEALMFGEKYGYRNAQVSVIAPTGTIGLLMDCDTTGVEPDFALVKFKKLAGGGYFKIANQSLRPALQNLGYEEPQVKQILTYVMGSLSLDVPLPSVDGSTPNGNGHRTTFADYLRQKGLVDEDLLRITEAVPTVFDLKTVFSAWGLGNDGLERLGLIEKKNVTDLDTLTEIGLTPSQIDTLNLAICGTQTVEGAPHLKEQHLEVFDCANRCGPLGKRFIAANGHIRMMAAAQPFISGAISKTINLPNNASVDDFKKAYRLSWELGLKANALYRDGCKLSQPLNSMASEEDAAEEDELGVEAGREEVVTEVAKVAQQIANKAEPAAQVDNIVERIIERPMRKRLPDRRPAINHKFSVAGHEGYLTVGLYEDGTPGELFITMAKEGSTIGGLMDSLGIAISVALQYGVPTESLVNKFTHQRFEPSGMTHNPDIPFAKSLVDYIFRWMGMEFIPGYRSANAPMRNSSIKTLSSDDQDKRGNGSDIEDEYRGRTPINQPRRTENPKRTGEATIEAGSIMGTAMKELQTDAPACDICGTITVRSGTCYKCLNCGNSMGCS